MMKVPSWVRRRGAGRVLVFATLALLLFVAFLVASWWLRGIAVPAIVAGGAFWFLTRRTGPFSDQERVGLKLAIVALGFYVVGPLMIFEVRLVILAVTLLVLFGLQSPRKLGVLAAASSILVLPAFSAVSVVQDPVVEQGLIPRITFGDSSQCGKWSFSAVMNCVGGVITDSSVKTTSYTAQGPQPAPRQVPPQESCSQAGKAWIAAENRCYEGSYDQWCSSAVLAGSVFSGGFCTCPPGKVQSGVTGRCEIQQAPPVQQPPSGPSGQQIECWAMYNSQEAIVRDGVCWPSQGAYDRGQCLSAPGRQWVNSRCRTDSELAAEACSSPRYWDGASCWPSSDSYQQDQCARSGKAWVSGRGCVSQAELCQGQGGSFVEGQGCFTVASLQKTCEDAGYAWVASSQRCYVMSTAQVPRGFEGVYVVAQTEQERAMVENVQLNLAKWSERTQKILDQQDVELRAFYQAEVDRKNAEFEESLRKATDAFERNMEGYRQALDAYKKDLERINRVNQFLGGRLTGTQYFDRPPATTAFGAVQAFAGSSYRQEIRIEFPKGFPTPTKAASGSEWLISLPVQVIFPSVSYEYAETDFRAHGLVFSFSANGGNTYSTKTIPIDVEGTVDRLEFNLKGGFPAGGSKYDLVAKVGVEYDELYGFDTGSSYTLPAYRESQVLSRTFYVSGNPFASGADVGTNVYDEASAPESSGDQPGGAAATYNAVGSATSRAAAEAGLWDRFTGLGLTFFVKYGAYLVGAVAIFILYTKEWLDWIRPVGRFRRRRAERRLERRLEAAAA